ncbi:GNAT family N-acetyltransferase [Flammeovirga kamogawensis]|uniref:GNAT family N-acetyltransferase n=1 Tax=Flammeovirga kamogawensis TaxID=373891 RepID=A0ABX8H4Z9_9BACT|nr:GNAT family N-acetyltransferase [Flammeovirga kamogawensis]MBB6461961.1 RimJ/RimL family protein N-acetyltransferase [Flammeovirga kamogawensis]QWG10432.1 GNAT family N-acetyltransferase [Flammeovirga kamogawensis]TRX63942.1 GNAT family N-acetyltransferase [Flammeovirga kamogawensis]
MENYIFKSERLGFRNWSENDNPKMGLINSNTTVMEYFPSILSQEQTDAFIERMKQQFLKNGFCYFAVDTLENNQFIGFIGISEQTFSADFTPCIDIGWRLSQSEWGKGYATEGAKKCLDFAFDEIGLTNIKAICPVINKNSEKVMKKIGMRKMKKFNHPLLSNYNKLEECVIYELSK